MMIFIFLPSYTIEIRINFEKIVPWYFLFVIKTNIPLSRNEIIINLVKQEHTLYDIQVITKRYVNKEIPVSSL